MNLDIFESSSNAVRIIDLSASDLYLYNLEKDPHERNNLVTDSVYKDIKKNLKEKLIKQMIQAGENISVIKDK